MVLPQLWNSTLGKTTLADLVDVTVMADMPHKILGPYPDRNPDPGNVIRIRETLSGSGKRYP